MPNVKHLLFENFAFCPLAKREKKQYSCTKEKRIHKKFPISECPAIFHSCVCRCTAPRLAYPRFGDIVRGSIAADARGCATAVVVAGHNLNLEIKAIGKGKRIKMKWPLKFCLALLRKQLASPKWRFLQPLSWLPDLEMAFFPAAKRPLF